MFGICACDCAGRQTAGPKKVAPTWVKFIEAHLLDCNGDE